MPAQKTIALTQFEWDAASKAKAYYEEIIGRRISWGAFIMALSFGALAVKGLAELNFICPNCHQGMAMVETLPKGYYREP